MPPAGNTALFALGSRPSFAGQSRFGVLDRVTSEFQSETLVDPGPAVKEIFIPVVLADRAVHLIFRTAAPKRDGYFCVDRGRIVGNSSPSGRSAIWFAPVTLRPATV